MTQRPQRTQRAGPGRVPDAMNPNFVWQDRELRFDSGRHGTSLKDLTLRRGEVLIDSINSVEDTKGNNGERGTFEVTNLRVIWTSHKRPRTNLSIGYKCITNVLIKATQSRLRGACQALHIHGKKPEEQVKHSNKDDSRRFEFIFTSLVKASPRLFTTMQAASSVLNHNAVREPAPRRHHQGP